MGTVNKVRSGEKIAGTMLRVVRNPAIIYLAKHAGLNFIMFDCEHAEYTMETMHDIALLGKAMDIACMARIPRLSKEYISRALDCGLEGIMVPMIETADQARQIVELAKYQPIGARGFTTGATHTDYLPGKFIDVTTSANENVMVIAQIETALAVENADEIAAVEGIDALIIGPNDLSVSLGVPGDILGEVETKAISRVADACERHGKLFSIHAGAGPAICDKFIDRLSFVMQGMDNNIIINGFKNIREYTDAKLNK